MRNSCFCVSQGWTDPTAIPRHTGLFMSWLKALWLSNLLIHWCVSVSQQSHLQLTLPERIEAGGVALWDLNKILINISVKQYRRGRGGIQNVRRWKKVHKGILLYYNQIIPWKTGLAEGNVWTGRQWSQEPEEEPETMQDFQLSKIKKSLFLEAKLLNELHSSSCRQDHHIFTCNWTVICCTKTWNT